MGCLTVDLVSVVAVVSWDVSFAECSCDLRFVAVYLVVWVVFVVFCWGVAYCWCLLAVLLL